MKMLLAAPFRIPFTPYEKKENAVRAKIIRVGQFSFENLLQAKYIGTM